MSTTETKVRLDSTSSHFPSFRYIVDIPSEEDSTRMQLQSRLSWSHSGSESVDKEKEWNLTTIWCRFAT
jgi:hypothetical protein